ncbi:transcriptional regulator, AraC family [Syntrophobotulus glycolicus DSM 8271]|uniref:Transcriptional regulator, AraC family n=2 Tax=Syntrophobotulus TaxID=51196 RepID=F0T2M5_SYNGF|nr:transcriptional regulator, AraC family [Syntrophobotulus glycolicus DSM 8271]
MRVLSQNEICTVYYIENKTGNGVITYYSIFPGVEVYYNDFHMSDGFKRQNMSNADIMEINHCREGRAECEFKSGGCEYLGEGDLTINMVAYPGDSLCFPLSHYHGISIAIDIPKASITLKKLFDTLGNVKIDFERIRKKTASDTGRFIMRATDSIQHIFSELYNAPDEMREGYIKLKLVELFMFLSSIDETKITEKRQYFYKPQVDTIKEMRKFLIEHLENRYKLVELSKKFSIPITSMKLCFKGIYGVPILTYMREYRLQAAAEMLRNSSLSIAEISEKIGYKNPAKFSSVFQKAMKLSPSDYRRKFCLQGTESDFGD